MTSCTNHCSLCGLHFHSVAAFDAHRQGDYESNDPELGRHCAHPLDLLDKDGEERLVVLAEGTCDLREPVQYDVRIYTLRRDLERARDYWGSTREVAEVEPPNVTEGTGS